jgi:long-chain fatty acid transport protein
VRASALTAALLLHGAAHAINGAQLGGNGVRNAAMGGVSIALPLDANAGANNPAGMAFVGRSATLDVQVFHGQSSADYVLPGNRLDNTQTLVAPQGGFNWTVSDSLALGLSLQGGGAGADYGSRPCPCPARATPRACCAWPSSSPPSPGSRARTWPWAWASPWRGRTSRPTA